MLLPLLQVTSRTIHSSAFHSHMQRVEKSWKMHAIITWQVLHSFSHAHPKEDFAVLADRRNRLGLLYSSNSPPRSTDDESVGSRKLY